MLLLKQSRNAVPESMDIDQDEDGNYTHGNTAAVKRSGLPARYDEVNIDHSEETGEAVYYTLESGRGKVCKVALICLIA